MEVKYLEIHYETLELFTDELLLYVVLWSGMLILDLHEVTDVKFEKSFGIRSYRIYSRLTKAQRGIRSCKL